MTVTHLQRTCALLTALCATPISYGVGAEAIRADGSTQAIGEPELQTIQSTTWPGWVALRLSHVAEPEAQSMAAFDDGQRVAGEFDSDQGEMRWRNRELGTVTVDLERLAWIGPPALAVTTPPTRDRLVLMNGDRVEGFINALRPDRGVEIELPPAKAGEAPERAWYDLSKGLACIQLVPRDHPASGWRFWLRDGSVVDLDAWQRVGERVVLTGCHLPGSAPAVSIPWRSVRAVASPARAVSALGMRPWISKDITDTPRLSPAWAESGELPGPLEIRGLDLHGPGIFTTKVPMGSALLVQVHAPQALAQDVDCTVTLLDGDRVLACHVLRGSGALLQVRDTIRSGTLTVKVDAGSRGAYGASVRLSEGLLIDAVTAPATTTPSPSSVPAAPSAPALPAPTESAAPRRDR